MISLVAASPCGLYVFLGKCVAIEGINSSVQALKNNSPVAAENFIAAVEDINTRWNKLVDGIFDREVLILEMMSAS